MRRLSPRGGVRLGGGDQELGDSKALRAIWGGGGGRWQMLLLDNTLSPEGMTVGQCKPYQDQTRPSEKEQGAALGKG